MEVFAWLMAVGHTCAWQPPLRVCALSLAVMSSQAVMGKTIIVLIVFIFAFTVINSLSFRQHTAELCWIKITDLSSCFCKQWIHQRWWAFTENTNYLYLWITQIVNTNAVQHNPVLAHITHSPVLLMIFFLVLSSKKTETCWTCIMTMNMHF